jgi:hypothetical protein
MNPKEGLSPSLRWPSYADQKDPAWPREGDEHPSYHCLFITTPDIPRSSIFNLGYALEVRCTRVGGWELIAGELHERKAIAGEYNHRSQWLILEVQKADGTFEEIVNSRDRQRPDEDDEPVEVESSPAKG